MVSVHLKEQQKITWKKTKIKKTCFTGTKKLQNLLSKRFKSGISKEIKNVTIKNQVILLLYF